MYVARAARRSSASWGWRLALRLDVAHQRRQILPSGRTGTSVDRSGSSRRKYAGCRQADNVGRGILVRGGLRLVRSGRLRRRGQGGGERQRDCQRQFEKRVHESLYRISRHRHRLTRHAYGLVSAVPASVSLHRNVSRRAWGHSLGRAVLPAVNVVVADALLLRNRQPRHQSCQGPLTHKIAMRATDRRER